MAQMLIRQAHGGEIFTIRSGALPYYLNQGYVVLDTIDDSGDIPPLYLSAIESDARYINITEMVAPESAFRALLEAVVAEQVASALGGASGVIVVHGDNASTARPSVAVPVIWYGTVEPTNADDALDVYVPVADA